MTSQSTWMEHFPGNMLWSNACLMTKAMAPYGGSVALGEIDEVCQRLMNQQNDAEAWQREWCALGARLEKVANQAAAEGRQHTAGNFYLRAGMYYFTGERFIPPGPLKREIGRKALELHHAGLLRRYPNKEPVEVPYEGTTLPALFLKAPGATGPAPTVGARQPRTVDRCMTCGEASPSGSEGRSLPYQRSMTHLPYSALDCTWWCS